MLSSSPRCLCRGSLVLQDKDTEKYQVIVFDEVEKDEFLWTKDHSNASTPTARTRTSSTTSLEEIQLLKVEDVEVDEERIAEAEGLLLEQQTLAAARVLRQVQESGKLSPHHWDILLNESPRIQHVVEEHSSTADWQKQAESHTPHYDMTTTYRYDSDNNLTARIDVVMEDSSLLLPLIVVLNESDLWGTWMPFLKFPLKMGVSPHATRRLQSKPGRGNQLALLALVLPFLGQCDTVIETTTTEDIEANHVIVVEARSVDDDDHTSNNFSLGFNAAFTIRPLPNHKMLLTATLSLTCSAAQQSMDYFTRAFAGPFFAALLSIARQVRDKKSKRQAHIQAMTQNPHTYQWVERRLERLAEASKEI